MRRLGRVSRDEAEFIHEAKALLGATIIDESPFDHVWHWRSRLPERKGQRCRVLSAGANNSVLVEFEDGETVVTSRHAVRRV